MTDTTSTPHTGDLADLKRVCNCSFDGSMMNSLQTVSYWDDFFGNPRGASLGLMSAIMSLGSICSTPIAPWVADKYGRRVGITVGSIIMIIGAIMQC